MTPLDLATTIGALLLAGGFALQTLAVILREPRGVLTAWIPWTLGYTLIGINAAGSTQVNANPIAATAFLVFLALATAFLYHTAAWLRDQRIRASIPALPPATTPTPAAIEPPPPPRQIPPELAEQRTVITHRVHHTHHITGPWAHHLNKPEPNLVEVFEVVERPELTQ